MEDLATFEMSELAKMNGFNEPTIDWFEKRKNGEWSEEYPDSYDFGYSTHNKKNNCIARPTLYSLQKWLREEFYLLVSNPEPDRWNNGQWSVEITSLDKKIKLEEFVDRQYWNILRCNKDFVKGLERGLLEALKKLNQNHTKGD